MREPKTSEQISFFPFIIFLKKSRIYFIQTDSNLRDLENMTMNQNQSGWNTMLSSFI